MKNFNSPWWLPGGHLQTLYPYLFHRDVTVKYTRERREIPDGDFLDFDWLIGDNYKPTLVMFHGLEGSSKSHYITATAKAFRKLGWTSVVPHFRGCSGSPNRLARSYHSGDTKEIDWILKTIKQTTNNAVFALGFSLGGNALLKWLGDSGSVAKNSLVAAAAVSVPMDLTITGDRLGYGINRIYSTHFLKTLKYKVLEKTSIFPKIADKKIITKAKTLRQFDDAYTAPNHGFKNVDHYWTNASCKKKLSLIKLPTLVIHSKNDPFLPNKYFPKKSYFSKEMQIEVFDKGGHAGFVTSPFPGKIDWLPNRIAEFFQDQRNHLE